MPHSTHFSRFSGFIFLEHQTEIACHPGYLPLSRDGSYLAKNGVQRFQATSDTELRTGVKSLSAALRTWPAPLLDRPADEVTRFKPQLFFKGARDDIHAGTFGKVKNPVELVAFTSLLGYR